MTRNGKFYPTLIHPHIRPAMNNICGGGVDDVCSRVQHSVYGCVWLCMVL